MSYSADPIYWALTTLREDRGRTIIAEAWKSWRGQEVSVVTENVWTSYRPYGKGRLVLDVTVGAAPDEQHRFQMLFLVELPRTDTGPLPQLTFDTSSAKDELPPFRIDPWNTTAHVIPSVPQPEGLATLLMPGTVAELIDGVTEEEIETIDLVRYVPMRRALIRVDAGGRVYFVKSFADADKYELAVDGLRLAADFPVNAPRLIGADRARSVFAMTGVPGEQLTERITEPALMHRQLLATGEALAALHRSRPDDGPIRPPEAELDDIDRLLVSDMEKVDPRAAERIRGVARRLTELAPQLPPVRPARVHGKLFGDQVLYDHHDGVAIVDWDDTTIGDPHFDLARLLAHLRFMSPREDASIGTGALLTGYGAAGGEIDPARLGWHLAAALLLRGKISLLRPLADDWADRLDLLIQDAELVLQGTVVRDIIADSARAWHPPSTEGART